MSEREERQKTLSRLSDKGLKGASASQSSPIGSVLPFSAFLDPQHSNSDQQQPLPAPISTWEN